MNAYRCDRCGDYFLHKEPANVKALLSLYSKEKQHFYAADLCITCLTSLHEWVRNGRIYFTDEELEEMDEKNNK